MEDFEEFYYHEVLEGRMSIKNYRRLLIEGSDECNAVVASELQKLSTRENGTIWYTDTENDIVMTLEDRIAELLNDDKQSSLSVVDEADNHEQDGKR